MRVRFGKPFTGMCAVVRTGESLGTRDFTLVNTYYLSGGRQRCWSTRDRGEGSWKVYENFWITSLDLAFSYPSNLLTPLVASPRFICICAFGVDVQDGTTWRDGRREEAGGIFRPHPSWNSIWPLSFSLVDSETVSAFARADGSWIRRFQLHSAGLMPQGRKGAAEYTRNCLA